MQNQANIAMDSMHEVTPGIFVGGYLAASDPVRIQHFGINRIIKMFADSAEYYGGAYEHPGVQKVVFDTHDTPEFDIRASLLAAHKILAQWRKENRKVLVHCHAGISRSVSVVLLYLMVYEGLSLDNALAKVRRVRPWAGPNAGFMATLRSIEEELCETRQSRANRQDPARHAIR